MLGRSDPGEEQSREGGSGKGSGTKTRPPATPGGGGMLLGHSAEEIARVRARATQAREPVPHYEHTQIGHNYRLFDAREKWTTYARQE